jgi:hypothetical protein
MRRLLPIALLTLGAAPLAAQDDQLAWLRPKAQPEDALRAYREKIYRPVRTDETRAAGFLTEGTLLPFGQVLGPADRTFARTAAPRATLAAGAILGVAAPAGATYAPGQLLVMGMLQPGPKGWGEKFIPTGVAVVEKDNAGTDQILVRVTSLYGILRRGQVVLPLEEVANPGVVDLVATPNGPSGRIIGHREERELHQPGEYLYTDLGRDDGMRIGDFVELRRPSGQRINNADAVADVAGLGQVVHVNATSSTVRITRVAAAGLNGEVHAVRVATLPGN